MKTLIALLLLTAAMTGCALYTPGGALIVNPDAGEAGATGHAGCPPGLAKQGRC